MLPGGGQQDADSIWGCLTVWLVSAFSPQAELELPPP